MAVWIYADDRFASSRFYRFSKEICVNTGARLSARISADTRYLFYINGELVCEGPCQGSEEVHYWEEVDLSPYLRAGNNRLEARVLYMVENYFVAAFRNGYPALWFDGVLEDDGKTEKLESDLTWSCVRDDSHLPFRGAPRTVHESVAPFEEVLDEKKETPVAIKLLYTPNEARGFYNHVGLREQYPLAKRPIPMMTVGEQTDFVRVREKKHYIDLDAGGYTTARVTVALKIPKGAKAYLIWAECYGKSKNQLDRAEEKGLRDAADDPEMSVSGIYDVLHGTGEVQYFTTFWYRAFRYLRVLCETDQPWELLAASYQNSFYPLDVQGDFSCSDERLDRMWQVSRNTVRCCMHEIFMDCPYYEQQQYQMDTALEMLFAFRLSDDKRLAKKALEELAASQVASGFLRANYPSTKVQIIPNFSLFWVLMARDYLRYTGDKETVRALLGTMDKVFEAFDGLRRADGLYQPTVYWNYVDWVPAWENGVPTGSDGEPCSITSLMLIAALRAAAALCLSLGKKEKAVAYEAQANEAAKAVIDSCFDSDAGLFRNTPSRREFCRHSTVWAILSGTVTGEAAAKLIDRTFAGHERVEECTFCMNYYLFRALETAGRYEAYAPRLFAGWQKMLDLHCTSWCENPDAPRSECHGWSSTPIYELSRVILGVYPTANGYAEAEIKPAIGLLGLQHANGRVPTPHGVIEVAWEIRDREATVRVTLPQPLIGHTRLLLPNGQDTCLCQQTQEFCYPWVVEG